MSNPAVIFLAECETKRGKSFRVEDNLGESIHIHYDNIRFDLTITELLQLSDLLTNIIDELIPCVDFKTNDFDPIFLKQISEYLLDLVSIKIEEVNILDLKAYTTIFLKIPVLRSIKHSRVYDALNGNTNKYKNYSQENFIFQTNLERLKSLEKLLDDNKYPYNNEYIILFNNQNIIRDGQHRAAILIKEKAKTVLVKRLYFRDNKYNTSRYPWIYYLFFWNKNRLKSLIRVFINYTKSMLNKFKFKILNLLNY